MEELIRAVDGATTLLERQTLHSAVVDALHRRSLEKEKLSTEVCDLRGSLDEHGQLEVVVAALKPVWEEKKQQVARTEVEIDKLLLLREKLDHQKNCRYVDSETMKQFLHHILRTSFGDCHRLLCLVTEVIKSDSMVSEFEVKQLCSRLQIDLSGSDSERELVAVLRHRLLDL